eukprot:4516055-Pleurochrysis_carterae.AAC.1
MAASRAITAGLVSGSRIDAALACLPASLACDFRATSFAIVPAASLPDDARLAPPPAPCAAESPPPSLRVCPAPPPAPMLVARSTFTMRCVAAGHPGGAPTHRSPCAPPTRSNRSLQSAVADSSAACDPD